MVHNPKKVIDGGFIQNLDGGKMEVQQNGIDLTLGSVEIINGGFLGREKREIMTYSKLDYDADGFYTFDPSRSYSITFQQSIKVPDNMCASIVQRSTLNRMGAFILSGVYDSGFENTIGAVLRTSALVRIQQGARIAQILFHEADAASLYNGVYQAK